MPEKEYKPTEELEAKEGYFKDPVSGRLVKITPERVEAKLVFAERLINEYGYSKEQIQTFPEFYIQKGSTKIGPADIVVFKDNRKTFDNIHLIVETKRKDKKDGIKQLKSYIDPTPAEGGVWFNGTEIVYVRAIRKPPSYTPELVEWRNIPKKGQSWEEIGQYKTGDELIPAKNLKSIFKVIYYHLYTNSNLPRAERLGGEMIRLIFCKIFDEIHNYKDLKFKAGAEEPDEKVAERIKGLFEKVKTEYQDVFEEDEKLLLDAKSIAYVASQLQNYSLLKTDKDAVGDAFEVFIGPALRGEKGQFFTPRNVVRLCVEILDPKPDEKVIDPACGSGGFLIVALEHIWKKIEENYKHLPEGKVGSIKTEIASKNFYGIDKEFDLAKVSKAYMAIVGDGRSGIFCADSLVSLEEWTPLQREKIKLGSFNILLTNPPFGSKIPITSKSLLEQYELGFKWKVDKKTGKWERTDKVLDKQVPQILFIERCLQLLKPGGRMAIVLPEGILGNIEDGYIREFILNKADILGIVDLPSETFQPSTATKTCILFLKKKNKKDSIMDRIFMAIACKVGHNKRGKPVKEDDLPFIAKYYKNKSENNKVFWIDKGTITDFNNFIPRRYDLKLSEPLEDIKKRKIPTISLKQLLQEKIISIQKGDEVGSENYIDEGIPFIRTNDIVNGIINRNSKQMVDEDLYNEIYKKKQDLKPGDILFTKDGKIGVVGMIKEGDECIIASGILKIRVKDTKKLNPFYLFAALNSKIVFSQAKARYVTAATIMHLHPARFLDIEIPFLPIEEQNKAGEEIARIFELKSKADNRLSELREAFLCLKKNLNQLKK